MMEYARRKDIENPKETQKRNLKVGKKNKLNKKKETPKKIP